MFMKVRRKLFGWLAMLALYPVVGWGQEESRIIQHPQTMTVCAGERAVFTSETDGGVTGWLVNGTPSTPLSDVTGSVIGNTATLTVCYNEIFDGLEVQSYVQAFGSPSVNSTVAYLFYKTNQQSRVTGLKHTVNRTTAQFDWNERNSSFTTHYLSGVYDKNNNQIANQTTDTTYVSFDLPPRANDECQWLEFRVTAVEVQHPECPDIEQTHYSTYLYTKPDVPPVTAEFNNKTVLVSWPSDGDNAFLVVVTDLESGNQTTYNGTSPFSYTPSLCGWFNLNVSVSPAQCANDPAFTHSDSISFTINCPTTATKATETEATETEATAQPSGTQAIYPSLLLAVAAIVPLLKWQH